MAALFDYLLRDYWSVIGTFTVWLNVPEVALTTSVKVPVTVCSRTSELALAEVAPSPEYFAVIAWVPTLSDETCRVATPLTGTTVPSTVLPLENTTFPFSGLSDWTPACSVTLVPETTLVFDEVRVMVVGLTELLPQPASPLTIPMASRVTARFVKYLRFGRHNRKRPAKLTVPEIAHSESCSFAELLVVPGGVVVRVTAPFVPGTTVAELQVTPSGRGPPQISVIGAV
jgi:hypothetical protein